MKAIKVSNEGQLLRDLAAIVGLTFEGAAA
jgi:hypothetical protein